MKRAYQKEIERSPGAAGALSSNDNKRSSTLTASSICIEIIEIRNDDNHEHIKKKAKRHSTVIEAISTLIADISENDNHSRAYQASMSASAASNNGENASALNHV